MKRGISWRACAGLLLFLGLPAQAILQPVTVTSEDAFPAPRWMYGVGEVPKGRDLNAQMGLVKSLQLSGDGEGCLQKAEAVFGKAKTLQPWLTLVMLDCAAKLPKTAAKASPKKTGPPAVVAENLQRVLVRVEKNPLWLTRGPQAPQLRAQVIKSYLFILEADLKPGSPAPWRALEKLQGMSGALDDKSKARMWRAAGEAAFTASNLDSARQYFRRSLSEQESEEVRARLAAVDRAAGVKSEKKDAVVSDEDDTNSPRSVSAALEASKEELDLVDRVTSLLKSGTLVPAVEDAIKLVRAFPGGTRAKWATDRVLEAYNTVAERSEPKLVLAHEQMVKLMEGADGDRLAEWSRMMYGRGLWEDSYSLGRKAVDAVTGARSTQVLDTTVKAALATDRFDAARELLDRLVKEHAGTAPAREALFRSGLLHYRLGENEAASGDFERLLSLPGIGSTEMLARYWLWRSLQKQKSKSDRADAMADSLMRKAPFSYYGLRARIDRAGGQIDWQTKPVKLSTPLWLTESERQSWARAMLLMKAGWLDEAQVELKDLPAPSGAEEKAMRALIWAAAGQYVNASRLANDAWDEVPDLRRPPFVNAAFPMEYGAVIEAQARNRKLDPYLVRGLIKQESSYNPRAVSTSNALGLMQMIPPTAKEIAQDLKLGALNLPDDMFQAPRNIEMGTYYLSRMLSRYQGCVPLALAAYNAGPTRIERWIKGRPSLKNVVSTRSSLADDELWFDEIPYAETSLYVKAILRNILIYKMLDLRRVQVSEPLWSYDAATSHR